MPSFVKMPSLSQTTNEVRFIRWLVREGDEVEKGQPICEVETDKVITEVESAESGVVLKLIAEPEAIIPQGQVIAVIGKKGEKLTPEILKEVSKITSSMVKETALKDELKETSKNGELSKEKPSHKKDEKKILKQEKTIEKEANENQRKLESQLTHMKQEAAEIKPNIKIKASPMVKNIAKKHGINLEEIKGTGPSGLITKRDIEDYLKSKRKIQQEPPKKSIESRLEDIDADKLLWMYKKMVEIRQFEERIRFLFLEGKMPGTIHQYIGMEACAVGVCAALQKDDVIASTHRPHGHALAKGLSMKEIMAELFGRVTGCCRGKGGSMHIGNIDKGMLPAIAIVGANIPIVVGIALAFKMRGEKRVAVSFFGDGASNEGAFHEGLNMAAVYNVPAVFVCENNQYGASTPLKIVTKIENIADRGSCYGMRSDIADGMDVVDVYLHAKQAIDSARNGLGPTLLELKTFRLCGHSRRDPCKYMSEEEKEYWKKRDPIPNFEKRLIEKNILSAEKAQKIKEKVEQEVEKAVKYAERSKFPDPEETLQGLYINMEVPE